MYRHLCFISVTRSFYIFLYFLVVQIPVGQFKIAGPHILRVVYAALERTRTEEMADESASSQIDIAADLLLRVCKAVLLRPLIRVDGDWKATLSQSEFSQLGSEFLQGLVSITSWQSFSVALLITLVTAPEQLVGHSISKSQQLSRAISTRLGLLLVSDDVLNFKISDLNLNLMHRQRTWSCLFAPLFAESQRQLTLSSGVKVRSLLTAICSLATSLSADILADSLSDLVVIVVQALMLSCDALFEQQPSVPLANPADGSILLVSAEIVNGSSTIVSASSMLPSSSTSQEEKRTTLDEQDLLLCNQSLSSLESLLSQNTELFSSHSSGIINRLLTVRVLTIYINLCI